MSRNKALALYLSGALGQIGIVCIIVFLLRKTGMKMDYSTVAGMAAIGIGGVSTALWGIITAIKYKKYELKKIVKDFFHIKQEYRSYLLAFLFIILDFFSVLFGGKFLLNSWYTPEILFFSAILFGGIEEIGWRYIFQPVLQERCSYLVSTVITFAMWGIWHFAYFYIDGTLSQVQALDFLIGLLTSCFILSALYIKTDSLWICVMTHALINVFMQLAAGGNQYVSYVCKIIIVILAVAVSGKRESASP